MSTDASATPAHRPSRRTEIIDAAISLFARKGFADASVSDVAEEADVAVTAIYYHFSGKDELYTAALDRVFESISEQAMSARPEGEPPELGRVIDAVWAWIDANPEQATLYGQLPGATRQVARLRREFEERHVQSSFRYLPGGEGGTSTKSAMAVETLTARTLVDLLISVHTMRLGAGPLSEERSADLRKAVKRLAERMLVEPLHT